MDGLRLTEPPTRTGAQQICQRARVALHHQAHQTVLDREPDKLYSALAARRRNLHQERQGVWPRAPCWPMCRCSATWASTRASCCRENKYTPLYCVCRQPSSGCMVCCECCQGWFHGRCVHVTARRVAEGLRCVCPDCCHTRPLTLLQGQATVASWCRLNTLRPYPASHVSLPIQNQQTATRGSAGVCTQAAKQEQRGKSPGRQGS